MHKSTSANRGLDWPDDYRDLQPKLLSDWGVGDELYLNRSLSAGRSGALVYEVDVSSKSFTGQAILKLDKVTGSADQAELETAQHAAAIVDSPDFATRHLPRIIHSIQSGDKLALLSTIAGRGLEYADPWQDCSFDRRLDAIKRVSRSLLEDWNSDYHLSDGLLMPQDMLTSWLDYRIDPARGGRIHTFLNQACDVPADTPSFMFNGHWFPNPLAFLDGIVETPQRLRMRGALGHVHGDFHGLNLLIEQSDWQGEDAELDFYLIDLAMYQSQQFLFYDHAYFEFVMLLSTRGGTSIENWESVISQLRKYRPEGEDGLKTDDLGLRELVRAIRRGVTDWINIREADRLSYMESQALLARVAVGLSFTHKLIGQQMRQMAFLYAATNLKDYLKLNRVEWPRSGPDFQFCDKDTADDETPSLEQIHEAVPQPISQNAVDENPTAPSTTAPPPSRQFGFGTLASVFAAIALIALLATSFFFWDLSRRQSEATTTGAQTETAATSEQDQPFTTGDVPSLAVLPFTSLGSNLDESFADGLTIELINVLAATEAFRIPGFTSVFQYQGNPTDLRTIGRSLDVEYIVEGSVRQIGDEFRIEANLVRSDDGYLIWSNTFREETEEIFYMQDVLAKAIGAALSVPLEFDFEDSPASGTQNVEAYERYLRGIALLERRGPGVADAITELEKAVELEPNFAAAWAALSLSYSVAPGYVTELDGRPFQPEVYWVKSKTAILNALENNPNLPIVQHAAGVVYEREAQWAQAERSFQAALAADGANHRTMLSYGGLLLTVGRMTEALEMLNRAISLDPNNDLYALMADRVLLEQTESAADLTDIESIFFRSEPLRSVAFRVILADHARNDDLDGAREILDSCSECSQEFLELAGSLLDAAIAGSAEDVFERFKDETILPYDLLYQIGGADAVLDAFEYNVLISYYRLPYFTVPWSVMDEIGDTERFKTIAEDVGLVGYWRAHGWPDRCVVIEEDFNCA